MNLGPETWFVPHLTWAWKSLPPIWIFSHVTLTIVKLKSVRVRLSFFYLRDKNRKSLTIKCTPVITRTHNTQFKDPLLYLPGVAGSRNLMPSYKHLAAGIRQVRATHSCTLEHIDDLSALAMCSGRQLHSPFFWTGDLGHASQWCAGSANVSLCITRRLIYEHPHELTLAHLLNHTLNSPIYSNSHSLTHLLTHKLPLIPSWPLSQARCPAVASLTSRTRTRCRYSLWPPTASRYLPHTQSLCLSPCVRGCWANCAHNCHPTIWHSYFGCCLFFSVVVVFFLLFFRCLLACRCLVVCVLAPRHKTYSGDKGH